MFEADTGALDIKKTIQVDTRQTIAFVSMRIETGVIYDGIRLYDEEMNYIVDHTWNEMPSS